MYRLPRGWKWAKGQGANVVRLATDGRAEVWLSHEGELYITTPPGAANMAPARVVLAVLAPLPSGIGGE